MIERFSQRLTEAKKKDTVVFAFGRMNPPTIGHGAVVDKVMEEAAKRNADHFIFTSASQDAKKNPLSQKQKVSYLKKFFPKGNFPVGKSINPFDTVLYLCQEGYKHIVVVTGSDHLAEYNKIKEYQGKADKSGRKYSFDTLEVVIAGQTRSDTAQGVAGMSASKMRAAAFEGDFAKFSTGVPGTDKALKKKLYDEVRKGLNLKEEFIPEATDPNEDVTILALTSSEKDLSDTIEKMEAICKKRKIEFYAVKTSKAQIDISNVASKKIVIKNYDGEGKDATIVPGNTVAIVRGGVMNSDIGVAIMTILQNNGVFMVNERGGMELCANKLETAIALKKHGLPHPRTAFVANEENIESAVKEIGGKFPVIVKTLTGAEGIGVSKIESMESLKSVLQTLWKYGAEVIMQEFLPDFKNDVRSIVLNGKIFACAKRDKAPKDFRTNIARGSKGGSFQLSDEEIKLVEQAARVSKCYYVGIDHVINEGKPYIIEMNASPGSGNIYYRYYEDGKGKDNVKGEEIVEDFLNYILNKAHWKLFSNLAVREEVKIDGVEYTAKIDTGNSGYNMIHGEEIKDNGNHTVTFKLPNGKKVTKKIVSRITVKSGIGVKKRLVILMDVEFHGKKYTNVKFSIGDRSHMSTKVLFGLQFLSKTGMMVDPADAIYPQPDVNAKRKSEEEEEEELAEDMPIAVALDATKEIIRTPAVATKLFTLVNKKKQMPPDQFKEYAKHVKDEVILQAYKASGATMNLSSFATQSKIGKFITKLIDKLVISGGIEVSTILNKAMSLTIPLTTILHMGDEAEGETIEEADIGKDKGYTTKSGKTKESPKGKAGLPKKYTTGLSKKEADLRKQRLAKRKGMSDDDPKTWEFVNPKEKDIKTKPSKYTQAFKKLAKSGKIKALKNQYEVEESLAAIRVLESLDQRSRISKAILLEQKALQGGRSDAAVVYRSFIEHEKDSLYQKYSDIPTTLDEDIEHLMTEVSPPSGPARRFSKKEKIKKEFQKRYGSRWKDVFYATAWKMHNDSYEPSANMIETAIDKMYEEIVLEGTPQSWTWTDKGTRGPLPIGTDKIVKTYMKDTPGERERLNEVADEEKDDIYKEWSKLVNMGPKELSNFIDSDEGEEAGLSRKEAGKAGASGGKIKSGRDSARAIVRMLERKKDSWSDNDWEWAKRQINFINRMKGAKGKLREPDGKATRKLLALKIWGHDPEKK